MKLFHTNQENQILSPKLCLEYLFHFTFFQQLSCFGFFFMLGYFFNIIIFFFIYYCFCLVVIIGFFFNIVYAKFDTLYNEGILIFIQVLDYTFGLWPWKTVRIVVSFCPDCISSLYWLVEIYDVKFYNTLIGWNIALCKGNNLVLN